MSRKLYVGNLPFDTSEGDLEQLFAQAGTVDTVRVMRDNATGRARGFAFVEMGSESDAQAAITKFDQQPFGGRTLTVNEAKPQGDRPGGFGASRGPRREARW